MLDLNFLSSFNVYDVSTRKSIKRCYKIQRALCIVVVRASYFWSVLLLGIFQYFQNFEHQFLINNEDEKLEVKIPFNILFVGFSKATELFFVVDGR